MAVQNGPMKLLKDLVKKAKRGLLEDESPVDAMDRIAVGSRKLLTPELLMHVDYWMMGVTCHTPSGFSGLYNFTTASLEEH